MKLIDTHSHLYEPEFDDDCEAAVARAREAGVAALLLPAIDTAGSSTSAAATPNTASR